MQESLHRWAHALLGLYFVEVTRHVCVASFRIVDDLRQASQTDHDEVGWRGVLERPPGGLDDELIFGGALGRVAFCQDGESAPGLTERTGQLY
jgi:hypothetical protein